MPNHFRRRATQCLPMLALLATVISPPGTSVGLAGAVDLPSFANPAARAAVLGLEAPTSTPNAQREACATPLNDAAPIACFASRRSAATYIGGSPLTSDNLMTLAGNGGTSVVTTNGTDLGRYTVGTACEYADCTGAFYWFFTSSTVQRGPSGPPSSIMCTHAYINNDDFRNALPTNVRYADNTQYGPLNCNTMAFYPGQYQEGAGATLCTSTGRLDRYAPAGVTWRSLSWMNSPGITKTDPTCPQV